MATFIEKSNNLMNETDTACNYTFDDLNGPTCPVCNLPLGEPNLCYEAGVSSYNPIINKNYKLTAKESAARRKQREEEWEGRRYRKPDTEVVIAATCGELFHKACLMKFCATSFKGNKRAGSLSARKEMERIKDKAHQSMPQCPRCSRGIMYTYHREVDIDSHRINCRTEFDRDFTKTTIVGQELKDQYERETKNFDKLDKVLTESESQLTKLKEKQEKTNELIPEGKLVSSKKEDLKTLKKRLENQKLLETNIDKAQKAIEYMQKETPVIMKMYIKLVKRRSREDIIKHTPIPEIFVDYLDKICEDAFCLFALSHIIKPAPYPGANFNENCLVSSILGKVDPAFKLKLERRASKLGHGDLMAAYENLNPKVDDKQTETTNELTSTISSRLIKFDGVTVCELYEDNNNCLTYGQQPNTPQFLVLESKAAHDLHGSRNEKPNDLKLSDLMNKSASQLLDEAVEEILGSPPTEESDVEQSECAVKTEFIHVRKPEKSDNGLKCHSSESVFERSHSSNMLQVKPRNPKSDAFVSGIESEELLRDRSSISIMVSDYEVDESYRPKPIMFEEDLSTSNENFIKEISRYDGCITTEWSVDEDETDLGRPETPQFPEPTPLTTLDNDTSGEDASVRIYSSLGKPSESDDIIRQAESIIAQCKHYMTKNDNANYKNTIESDKPIVSEIGSELDSDLEYTPSGNVLCTVFKSKADDANASTPATGFLEFLSTKDIKQMESPLPPPSSSTPVFVTCVAPNLTKYDSDMNPYFPKAPEVVAYGPLKKTDGTDLKVPLPYLGHYPPRHEVNRAWVTQMESPTNVALGDWCTSPVPLPPGYVLPPPIPPPKVSAKNASDKYSLLQPFPQMATYLSLRKQVSEAPFYESCPTQHLDSCQPDDTNHILPSKYSLMLSSLEMGTGYDDEASNASADGNRVYFNMENEKYGNSQRCYSMQDYLLMKRSENDSSGRNSSLPCGRQTSKASKSQKSSAGSEGVKLEVTTPATAAIGWEDWSKYNMMKRSGNRTSTTLTPRRNKSSDFVEPRRLRDQNTERKRSLPGMRKTHFKDNDVYYYVGDSDGTGERKKLWKSSFFSGKSN